MLTTGNDLKEYLEGLVEKYEVLDFIPDDPVRFLHRYKRVEDVEIAGFIASIFAFGSRKVFLQKLEILFDLMDEGPYQYVINGDFKLDNFVYRFLKAQDVIGVFQVLHKLYLYDGGLKALFRKAIASGDLMQYVCDYFYKNAPQFVGKGFLFAIPNPKCKGAMKRMWMFLRWMVRKSVVDVGVWQDIMKPSQLKIPLDTHVARVSRELGLLKRSGNGWCAVEEVTSKLREFDPEDPIKYDFALFGYGIDNY